MQAWDPASLQAGRALHLPGDDAAVVRPQSPLAVREARAFVPRRPRSRSHLRRGGDRRGHEPASVPVPGSAASSWRTMAIYASSRTMRYSLVEHVRPELAECIEGTTDSEWIYALVLSQLDDPWGRPEARELAEATAAALRILRKVREAHAIDTSSPVNLCLSTGRALVATRFSFDYGWYPPGGRVPRGRPSVREPLVRDRRRVRRERRRLGDDRGRGAALLDHCVGAVDERPLVVARGAGVLDADRPRSAPTVCSSSRRATWMSEPETVSFLAGVPLLEGRDPDDLEELAEATSASDSEVR